MKKILFLSLLVAGLGFGASAQIDRVVKAPDSTQMKMRGQQDGRMRQGNQQMLKDLNLTDVQKEQFKKNNEEMRAKMEALRDNASLSQDDKRTQMKAIRDEQKAKMDALLTPEQKIKFDEMRKKMMEERKQKPDMGKVDPKTNDNNNFKSEPQ